MEKIAFKNRFRIIAPNGQICRLNSGVDGRFIEGFDTLEEATLTRNIYFNRAGENIEAYIIESYAEPLKLVVPVVKQKAFNNELSRLRVFNGKALKFNTMLRSKDENRYKPDKFYSKEVWFAQSAERSKGQSLIAKIKPKKESSTSDRDKTIADMNHGSFIESRLLDTFKAMKFPNRKTLKDYLKPRGFTKRQMDKIAHQIWA